MKRKSKKRTAICRIAVSLHLSLLIALPFFSVSAYRNGRGIRPAVLYAALLLLFLVVQSGKNLLSILLLSPTLLPILIPLGQDLCEAAGMNGRFYSFLLMICIIFNLYSAAAIVLCLIGALFARLRGK